MQGFCRSPADRRAGGKMAARAGAAAPLTADGAAVQPSGGDRPIHRDRDRPARIAAAETRAAHRNADPPEQKAADGKPAGCLRVA